MSDTIRRLQARYDTAAERWDLAAATFGDQMTFYPLTAEQIEQHRERVRRAKAAAETALAELKAARREVAA